METIGTMAGGTWEILGDHIINHPHWEFWEKKRVLLIITPGPQQLKKPNVAVINVLREKLSCDTYEGKKYWGNMKLRKT